MSDFVDTEQLTVFQIENKFNARRFGIQKHLHLKWLTLFLEGIRRQGKMAAIRS